MKDYVKHKRKKRQRSNIKRLLGMIGGLCLLIMGLAMYVCYQQDLTVSSVKTMAFLKLSTFFPPTLKKKEPHAKVKHLAAETPDAMKPIHFDFYDELPKVQLGLSEKQFPAAEKEEQHLPATVLATQKPSQESFSSQSIEQDLHDDLSAIKSSEKSATYILQFGIFPQLEAANRYREALRSAGLKVEVVKLRQGSHVVYRLQQGPYHNMEQLKSAKKRFAARGVTCDIQKLSPYQM